MREITEADAAALAEILDQLLADDGNTMGFIDAARLGPAKVAEIRAEWAALLGRLNRRLPESLDDRILALTAGIPEEAAEAIRSPLAYLRETWRGGDYHADIAEALAVIAGAADTIRREISGGTIDG